ncbi:MAG TPA: hypothetical protein VN577_16780 [Terriglobales bacterium]|nr:hypothetical protein [Terriglobales bacterium]
MKKLRWMMAVAVSLSLCGLVVAQASAPSGDDSSKQEDSKDKKKKDKKKGASQDELDSEVFSDAVARNVMEDLREGLEGHSQRRMLSAFDGDKFDGFLSFEDQIQAMFDKYDSFRVHFRIVQTTVEGPKGVILVDFSMEEIPRGTESMPQRKNSQIRFELERGRKGWKIVDMNPRGFFS